MSDYSSKTKTGVMIAIMSGLVGLCSLCGKDFFEFMDCFYVCFPPIFYCMLFTVASYKQELYDGCMKVLSKCKTSSMVSAHSALFWKERLLLSDKQYEAIRRVWMLQYALPSIYSLKKARSTLNKELVRFFNVKVTKHGVHCDPQVLMISALLAAKNHRKLYAQKRKKGKKGNKFIEPGEVPKDIIYKLSTDGFSIDKSNFTVLGFQFLNMQEYYPKKSAHSWLYSSILFDKENYDLMNNEESFLGDFCRKKMLRFEHDGERFHFNLKKLWCSDLLSLEHTCKSFDLKSTCCPYCWYTKDHETSHRIINVFPQRSIENLFHFNSDEIYFCILHAFERVMENMLYNVTRGKKANKEKMMAVFQKHGKLRGLKFTTKDTISDMENGWVFEKLSMITGNQISYIFKHLNILDPLFDQATKNEEKKLFEVLRDIWHFLHRPLDFYNDDNNLEKFVELMNVFLGHVQVYQGDDCYYSIYLHILSAHTIPCIVRLRNMGLTLEDVDQSSFEHGNLILKTIEKGAISKYYPISERKCWDQKFLQNNNMLDIQDILGWKADMTTQDKELFQKQFQALQIMLFNLRKLFLSAFREFPLRDLPTFDCEPKKPSTSIASVVFNHLHAVGQVSKEVLQNLLKVDIWPEFNYNTYKSQLVQIIHTFKEAPTQQPISVDPNDPNNLANLQQRANPQNRVDHCDSEQFAKDFQELNQLMQLIQQNQATFNLRSQELGVQGLNVSNCPELQQYANTQTFLISNYNKRKSKLQVLIGGSASSAEVTEQSTPNGFNYQNNHIQPLQSDFMQQLSQQFAQSNVTVQQSTQQSQNYQNIMQISQNVISELPQTTGDFIQTTVDSTMQPPKNISSILQEDDDDREQHSYVPTMDDEILELNNEEEENEEQPEESDIPFSNIIPNVELENDSNNQGENMKLQNDLNNQRENMQLDFEENNVNNVNETRTYPELQLQDLTVLNPNIEMLTTDEAAQNFTRFFSTDFPDENEEEAAPQKTTFSQQFVVQSQSNKRRKTAT